MLLVACFWKSRLSYHGVFQYGNTQRLTTNCSEIGFLSQCCLWQYLPKLTCGTCVYSKYAVIYLCCSVVDHISVVHFFILTFSLFSLSILFHDWQRAFLVNQPSLTWFPPHLKPYSSSSPHCSPWLSLSLLPSTLLLLCYHLLADGQNSALIRLGPNAFRELLKYEISWLISDMP